MLARWKAVEGPHPLCDKDTLRSELAFIEKIPPRPQPELGTAVRSAVVVVLGRMPGKGGEKRDFWVVDIFAKNAESKDRLFLKPFGFDLVVLYQMDANLECQILSKFASLRWIRSGGPGPSCNHSKDVSGNFTTPAGTRVFLRGRDFHLPRYIRKDMALLDNQVGPCVSVILLVA